jgi:Platelet-activating factor acetylhydrolase, isoform II
LAFCILLAGTMPLRAADRPSLPPPSGSYGIGRVSYELTDPSRPEPLSSKLGAHRRMMVYVWYPTDQNASNGKETAPYLPGLDEAKSKISPGDISDMFRPATYDGPHSLPATVVVDHAPMAHGRQRFPLLLFGHGWGNPTFLYTAELEDIVSHGYIVAAIEHPYDTNYTRFPDGELTGFAQASFDKAAKQPHGIRAYTKERVEVMAQDNQYALTQLLHYAHTRNLHAPFYERIDADTIGAFGHSIGGLTAARTCQIDARVKACMDQDSTDYRGSAFVVSDLQQTERQPFFLYVVSSADVWSSKALNPSDAELAQQKLTRPEFNAIMQEQQQNQTTQLAGIVGGSYRLMLFDLPGYIHRSFTDQTLLASSLDHEQSLHNFHVAETYTLAFFNKYLKGDTETILDTGKTVDGRAKLERFPPH